MTEYLCRPCEDTGYYWDSTEPCSYCKKGKRIEYEQNKESLKYHNAAARRLRKEIKEYESKIEKGRPK